MQFLSNDERQFPVTHDEVKSNLETTSTINECLSSVRQMTLFKCEYHIFIKLKKNSFHFLLSRHLWCAIHDASGCPSRLADCPPRHSGVAAGVPDLQHGPHAPTPSLPVRAEGDSETAHLQLSYASLCHPC